MAFDGMTVSALVWELSCTLKNAKITKITQPETDELLLTLKSEIGSRRLYISASASLPLIFLVEENRPSPMTAPAFCMLLRKHIGGGRIVSISQPSLERIICFTIQHLDDLGDSCMRRLYVEIMGRHSNVILCDDSDVIIDSLKRIPSHVSSLREVIPGRPYYIVDNAAKLNPRTLRFHDFSQAVFSKPLPVAKALYQSLTGISPVAAHDILCRSGVDSMISARDADDASRHRLFDSLTFLMDCVTHHQYAPAIYLENGSPREFSVLPLSSFREYEQIEFSSVSLMLSQYYHTKNMINRVRQKSADLRKILQTALERNYRKYDLQAKQLADTENREIYKEYGELIQAYGYSLPEGAGVLECENYYTGLEVSIPLNPHISPMENATRYFEKYNKQKRTRKALQTLIQETSTEIGYLEGVKLSLDMAVTGEDLSEIKTELTESGFIRKRGGSGKKNKKASVSPLHYISSDGFDIFVGKNNIQNEYITFSLADSHDWWFHAKGVPGSHVVLKSRGEETPDRTFEEAARLAAHYSRNAGADKVEVDYVQRKHVKKPHGAKPGFVVYYTNYSMTISTEIRGIKMQE